MYKVIVMHVDEAALTGERLATIVQAAGEFGAHLVGTAATGWPQLEYFPALATPMVPMLPWDHEALREGAASLLKRFEQRCHALGGASLETRLLDGCTEDAMVLQSRYADLLVVGQGELTDRNPLLSTRLAGYLAVNAACPVLLMPAEPVQRALTGTIVVAWNASAEARHAVVAALPFLLRAERVVLAVFNPEQAGALHGESPGADLAVYLARHGVSVDIVCTKTSLHAGVAIVTLALNAGAGLIVAGAYGHNRLNEWFLGGTSMRLLQQSAIPVLMMH